MLLLDHATRSSYALAPPGAAPLRVPNTTTPAGAQSSLALVQPAIFALLAIQSSATAPLSIASQPSTTKNLTPSQQTTKEFLIDTFEPFSDHDYVEILIPTRIIPSPATNCRSPLPPMLLFLRGTIRQRLC